ncbi:hypothetical protein Thimo_0491 [Thioflavicoccus mobilis 8321]|uniref:Rap1a immunity protein domain-containing protein n=1 Tax=Thioflavicoccus mobilis 8321 TaxID=765912 RepID=L0GTM1_9GAMM|nr:hypothetical protein [Thioflavicoccus mobilis]AGA89346.1 hypothetical protein Thimo_0491 [Thioflavicoccus mobilis 8321]
MTLVNIMRGRRPRATLVAFALLFSAPAADAGDGATVGQVLAACERGFAAGGKGLDAAICDWSLLPCACHSPADGPQAGPRWCIPPAQAPAATIAAVAAELRRHPERSAAVEQVVPQILARVYPCPSDRP